MHNHWIGQPRGWSTPLTRPAASNSLVSSMMNSCRSKACFLTFCLTGRTRGQTTRWCSITTLGTPGMSDPCHANTSTFARRKVMSAPSYLLSRVELMVKSPPVPSSLTDTLLVSGGACHSPRSALVCFCFSIHATCLNFMKFEMGMTKP